MEDVARDPSDIAIIGLHLIGLDLLKGGLKGREEGLVVEVVAKGIELLGSRLGVGVGVGGRSQDRAS